MEARRKRGEGIMIHISMRKSQSTNYCYYSPKYIHCFLLEAVKSHGLGSGDIPEKKKESKIKHLI